MMNTYTISDSAEFTITYSFFDETHETELSMLINGINILAFERNDTVLTTRWNLDELAEWLRNFLRHRWHPASSGAILADVYFQLVGDNVEISWNNEDFGNDIHFQNQLGGARINKDIFYTTIDTFLKAYATHWLT